MSVRFELREISGDPKDRGSLVALEAWETSIPASVNPSEGLRKMAYERCRAVHDELLEALLREVAQSLGF